MLWVDFLEWVEIENKLGETMSKNVIINGVTYSNVPYVEIPLSGTSGNAEFYDTSDATLDSGSKMLSGSSAYSNGVKYDGSIVSKTSSDLTASGATVTVPAGYYGTQATKSVTNGSATAPAIISGTSATVSTGTNTLSLNKTISVTPTVTAGYVASGTAGNSSVTLTASVTTKAAATITPGTSNQEIAAGTYLKGKQTILGSANLQAQYIKDGIEIFGITGTLSSAAITQDSTTKALTIS